AGHAAGVSPIGPRRRRSPHGRRRTGPFCQRRLHRQVACPAAVAARDPRPGRVTTHFFERSAARPHFPDGDTIMNPAMSQHPDRADLEAYGLGMLLPPASDALEHHLAVCEQCGQMLGAVRDDWLVGLLRAGTVAEPRAVTVSEAAPGTQV